MTTASLEPKHFFQHLPLIYDIAGLSQYAQTFTPSLLEFLYIHDWIGRNILELGCGTGTSTEHFLEQKMSVDAIDQSATMLSTAKQRLVEESMSAEALNLAQADFRTIKPRQGAYDLVFSLDTMNYVTNPRDFENVLRRINFALPIGKIFLFDLQTVYGLAKEANQHPNHILHQSETDFFLSHSKFDYDMSVLEIQYFLFYTRPTGRLERLEETHYLRGYPYRGVWAMLERAGFTVKHVLDLDLKPVGDVLGKQERIFFIAEKAADFKA